MTDYLAELLALLEDREEPDGGDWPEHRRSPAVWNNSVPEAELLRAVPGERAAGEERFRRVYIDAILQADRLETLYIGQGDGRERLLGFSEVQEPPEAGGWQEALSDASLPGSKIEAWDEPAGPARDAPALLEQLRSSRQAVGYVLRQSAGGAQVPDRESFLGQEERRMARVRARQTQEQDTARLVDRAFRRDARRYDGGFALF